MPPKVISGGDNPYDIHDAKLSSSATAHESSSVTAHEISNIRICDIITDGLNNVFADVDSIHKTDLLEVRLRVRAAANIPLTDKVAKRPHFWEVLSSLLMNLF